MGAIFSTILITAPLAFMVGWLVSKAVFRQLEIVRPRTVAPPAAAADATAETTRQKPDIPGRSNDQHIALLEQRLEVAQADKRAALTEVQLLKEAGAEREQRMIDLQEQLRTAYLPPEDTAAGANELQNVKHSRDMRDLQARIDKSDHEIAELRHELIAAERRLDGARARFTKWRGRFKPLARQLRQQKMIIAELRDEMRKREQTQPQTAEQSPPAVQASAQPAREPAEPRDNLERLRGVGPALQGKLNDKGIYRLEQLANMNYMDMLQLGRSLGISERQIAKHDWNTQAGQLLRRPEPSARPDTPVQQANA